MPNIIIEEIVTNVTLNIEEVVSTVTIQINEMQMPGAPGYTPIKGVDYFDGEQGIPGTTDHLALTNVGTNTHAQIDTDLTRLANTSGNNTGDQDISGKVDKVLNKSLILDTEITRLASVSNVDISGKEDTSNKKTDVETNKTSDTFFPSIKSIVDWVTNLFVKGSGTAKYLPKFGVGGKVVGNSQIFDDGTNVGFGTNDPRYKLHAILATTGSSGFLLQGGSNMGDLTQLLFKSTTDISTNFIKGALIWEDSGESNARGNLHIAVNIDDNTSSVAVGDARITVKSNGDVKIKGSVQVGDNTAVASATNVGATRYRAIANNSYLETCMQTSLSGYAWVIIKQNTW